MFIEMKKQTLAFQFGGVRFWLRYDIRAFYHIEEEGYSPFDFLSQSGDPKAVRCFLRNGLADWYGGIRDENGIDAYVNRLMCARDFQKELIGSVQAAILLALPDAPRGNGRKSGGKSANILGLMSAFIDVMGAPHDEFMRSTPREAAERWERYASVMGYIKPAEKFSRYDDDE